LYPDVDVECVPCCDPVFEPDEPAADPVFPVFEPAADPVIEPVDAVVDCLVVLCEVVKAVVVAWYWE
jgi:hypothetical protein